MTDVSPRYDVVLLDLDGTIIDSEPGVQAALRHALMTGFDIVPTQAQLEEFMGPPLSEVLPRVFGLHDPSDEQRFFELYCEVYFHGTEYEFDVYPGMTSLIADLRAAGSRVCLATAKPDESAARILENADLLQHFEFVGGSHIDGSRQDKVEVLEHTLRCIDVDSGRHRIVVVGESALVSTAQQWRDFVTSDTSDVLLLLGTHDLPDADGRVATAAEINRWTQENSSSLPIGTQVNFVEDGGGLSFSPPPDDSGAKAIELALDWLDDRDTPGAPPPVVSDHFEVAVRPSMLAKRGVRLPAIYIEAARENGTLYE